MKEEIQNNKGVVFKITITEKDFKNALNIIASGVHPDELEEHRNELRAIKEKGEALLEGNSLLKTSLILSYLNQEHKKREGNERD